jgi:hypothetical protein
MSKRVLSVGHRRDFVSPAVCRRVQAVLLVKRVVREKEGRALRLNLASSHREVEHKLRASSAVRGNQRSAVPISRNAQAKNRREERHRRGNNKFSAVFTAAPKQKLRSRVFLVS